MSKRLTTQHTGTAIATNDPSLKDLKKKAKSLVEYLEYHGKRNNWRYKILIVGSEVDGSLCEMVNIVQGRGRPQKKFIPYKCVERRGIPWKTEPHLHFIIKANPGSQIVKMLSEFWTNELNNGNGVFRTRKTQNGLNDKSYIPYMERQECFRTERNMGYVGKWQ